MDISVQTTTQQVSDKTWKVASLYPARTVTLDISAFTEGTFYPNGYIPAGTALAKHSSGLYVPYNNGGSSGAEICKGLLAEDKPIRPGSTADVGAAMLEDGLIIKAKLPFQSGTGYIDSAAITDLAGWFKFLDA